MLEGIKLLIERMDSHPEEFTGDLSYRWANIMQDIAKHGPEYLDEEDLLALNRKVKEVRRKELNAKIVDEIHNARRLKKAQEEFEMKENMAQKAAASSFTFGQAKVKGQGSPVSYFTWMNEDAPDHARL